MFIRLRSKIELCSKEGGEPAGIIASVAVARRGLDVILVESQGCLGGSRTATDVDTFYGFYTPGTAKKIVGGIPWEVVERLKDRNACFERPNTYGAGTGVTYDVETLKMVYESLALDVGVRLLYHTYASQVVSDGETVRSVVVANKSGLTSIEAKYYIDTTGDGDIAARAGAPFEVSDLNELQSLTTIFFLGTVNVEEANRSGEYRLPREDGSWHVTPNPGVIQANMVRVTRVNATDPFELTMAEIEGRKQAHEYTRFLKDSIPGFQDSFLISTSQYIGVRETRRIIGDYVLPEEDVVNGEKFDDAVACCATPVEDHTSGSGTRWAYAKENGYYHIPYRALVPKNAKNVIVAGRCLSATHGAQTSARNSAQCMAMGQAAGIAAAILCGSGIGVDDFYRINVAKLQAELKEQGVIL